MVERFGSGGHYEAIVGYSRTVRAGDLVLVSGCTATGAGGVVLGPGDPSVQADETLDACERGLALAGASLADVVRTRVYLTDVSHWEIVGRAHATIFPLVFLLAFAGGLSGLANVPGFDFPSGYTSFQFVFVFMQSAAFGGVFTGFAVAADYESGFARRLMLAAPNRTGLIAGYVLAGIGRFLFTALVVSVAGLAAGMRIDGGVVDVGGLLVLAVMVNVVATLFGVGLCMRTQSMQSVPFLQIPVFTILFMAPVYVPLDLLHGWISVVAPYNPATAFLEAGRGFVSGEHASVGPAFAAAAAMLVLLGLYALRGLRSAERGG